MRRAMIIGNWKMYTDAADASILATTVRNNVSNLANIEVVLCPPFVWLAEVANIVGKGKIGVGAQNMFYEPEGPFTGEISPLMIKDIAKYVIVGHSERRENFNETDADVNEKVIAALRAGLSPIICVGERTKSSKFPTGPVKQLKEALMHVPKSSYKNIIIAYEPTWAISTTKNSENCDGAYASRVASALREIVLRDCPILYGGSINSKTVREYGDHPEIDGVLVGSASLRAADFVKVCKVWSECKNFK